MNKLIEQDNQLHIDSREVAEMVEKRHDNLVRDIDGYVAVLDHSSKLRADSFFIEKAYSAGTGKKYKHYLLTRKGCEMVANKMNGEKGILFTAEYVTRFDEMQKELDNPFKLPKNYKEALLELVNKEEQNEMLQLTIDQQQPKVAFADAVTASESSILILELAKILTQNGYITGQKRLFEELREKGYLIKKLGSDYNSPTQKAMNLKLFEIKETVITHSDGRSSVSKTTKVTGKGQQYFINKFVASKSITAV